jgi:hypothetical protein
MSQHRRYQQLAAQALDFGATTAEAADLAAHLRDCTDCRRFDAGLRTDEALVRSWSRAHAPERVRHAVVTAATSSVRPSGLERVTPLVAVVAVLAALVLGWGWLALAQPAGPGHQPVRTWMRLGAVPAFADATVSDVVSTGSELVAVGQAPEGGRLVVAMWVSQDGLSWQRLPTDPLFVSAAALGVAAKGDTLVALGIGGSARPTSPPFIRVWLTHKQAGCDACPLVGSGSSWQTAIIPLPTSGDSVHLLSAITAGGGRFVLVGTEIANPGVGDSPVGAIVASSTDGLTWSIGDPVSLELIAGSMQAVAAGSSGLVAVGETALVPSVWVSGDGVTWTRAPSAFSSQTITLRGVAAGPAGFVAVGDDNGSAVSWMSGDGQSWQAAPPSATLANARMERIFRIGAEFLAIGERDGDGTAWTSTDGLTWTQLDTGSIFSGTQLWNAVAVGSRTLLFGLDASQRQVVAVGQAPQP